MRSFEFFLDKLSFLGRAEITCYGYGQFWDLRKTSDFNPIRENEALRQRLISLTLAEHDIPAIIRDAHHVMYACILWEAAPIIDPVTGVQREATEADRRNPGRWVWYFVGPSALQRMNKAELHRYYRSYSAKKLQEKHPPLLSFERFLSMIQIASMVLGKKTDEQELIRRNHLDAGIHVNLPEDQIRFAMRQEEEENAHHSYAEEQVMLNYVREGDGENALAANRKLDQESGRLSDIQAEHWRKIVLIAITLTTRAAIEGGLSPAESYTLSDYYLHKSDGCPDVPSLIACRDEAVLDFCDRVKTQKRRNTYSRCVSQCRDYINRHYREKISQTDLAGQLQVSASYLSRSFTRETGMSMEDYIIRVRIERASNLLRFSGQSIAAIGDYVGFSTQSYFSRTFRKVTGMTPGQYRKKNQIRTS